MQVVLPILALAMCHVFSNAVRTLPAVAADLLCRDLSVTPEQLAGITGAFPACFALAMVPVGVALDRWGGCGAPRWCCSPSRWPARCWPCWRPARAPCWRRNACWGWAVPAC